MNDYTPKSKIITSFIWRILEKGGTQGVSFIISLVLARILTPDDYGLISLTTVFITLANVFMQTGLNSALIQKKEVDSLDYSTVFLSSIILSVFLYGVLFYSAEWIALYYKEDELIAILRILGLTLFISAINSIQIAIISREMKFNVLFISSMVAAIISGLIGLMFAYQGYGVWALVVQQLIQQIVSMLVLFKIIKWKPKINFSITRFKSLFNFSSNILAAALIDTFYANLRSLLIGRYYSVNLLGYYNRGKQFPSLLVENINGSIQTVMLPAYSKEQDNKDIVKLMMRKTIETSVYIVFPMMVGLTCIAESLVTLVLTEKWLPCIPFLKIYCFAYALLPLEAASLQALKAIGDSKLFLKMEIIKKIFGLLVLILSLPFGVYYIALGVIINGIFSIVLNSYINNKVFNYNISEQISDIIGSLVISIMMGIVVISIQLLNYPIISTLLIQIIIGIMVYIIFSKIFNIKSFHFINKTILSFYLR